MLEHLAEPVEALERLKTVLKPGGTITVIEGDHGSAYFHPDSEAAHEAIQCQVTLQRDAGGNSLIGRQVYPLLTGAGFEDVHVSPRLVYVDDSRPELVDGFTRKTFTAMIEGVREVAIGTGLIDAGALRRGHPRPVPHRRRRRHLPLHVLQGRRAALSEGMIAAPRSSLPTWTR